MSQCMKEKHYDVVVIGGGSAGISAAISAAKNGAKTLIVESGPMVGGDLLAGLPVDGCISSRGEWIVGGVAKELFDECEMLGGYVGAFSDRRALWVVTLDPQIMGFVTVNALTKYNVSMLLYSFAEDVVVDNGMVKGVIVVNKSGRTLITADVFIDCTGDGDIAAAAGAPFEIGGPKGELQPVSMVFRMCNVEAENLLAFVRDYPENVGLAENPIITKSKKECALELYEQGLPKVFLEGTGPLLSDAIAKGDMYPTSLLAITPVSMVKKEVSINSTRMDGVNAIKAEELCGSLPTLLKQVDICRRFLVKSVPGFEKAVLAGIAPRIGVRETRRIMGDYILNEDDILEARKSENGIAKGGHELDIHGGETNHKRAQIKDAGSYDIPYGCLIVKNLENLLIAGRCLSSTREAHSSARVMGTCMATGQAAGTAAAMCTSNKMNVRELSTQDLRRTLKEQGAILDGTY